jgi:arylsulfatase A-like enzyme
MADAGTGAGGRDTERLIRAALLTLSLVLLEALVRLVILGPRMSWSERSLDAFVRTANIGALVGPLVLGALLWSRLPGRPATRVTAAVRRGVEILCRPWALLRLGVVYGLGLTALALTLCQRYDLAWHTAAFFAAGLLVPAAGVELLLQRRRPAPVPRVHPLGRIAWGGGAAALGLLVCPLLLTAQWTALATLPVLYLVLPVPRLPRRAVQVLLGGTAVAILLGLWLDGTQPGLRRLRSVHAAYSDQGSSLLRWVTDLDRDGSSGLLGLDCDDLDPDRSPLLRDRPGDGIDQNCTGADADVDAARARLVRGGAHAAPPPSFAPGWRPDVYLVTIDALRWDVLGAGDASLMPETRRWAEGCVRFSTARTNATFTNLALIALLTGMLPQHAMKGMEALIAVGTRGDGTTQTLPPTLPTVLAAQGYRARAIVPVKHYTRMLLHGVEVEHSLHQPVAEVFAAARAHIDAAGDWPLFLWLHLMDVHAPYPGGQDRAHYDRAVRRLDAPLADFLRSLGDDVVIVLAADHGEAFGEHGYRFHGSTLFEEELRVPLVLCVPASRGLGAPRRVDTPVSLVDVSPTVLDLLGLDAGYPQHGESLVGHLRTGAPLRSAWTHFVAQTRWSRGEGVIDGCLKLIRDLDHEWEALFDLCEDPGEVVDLSSSRPDAAARMHALLGEIRDADIDTYRSWDLDVLRGR